MAKMVGKAETADKGRTAQSVWCFIGYLQRLVCRRNPYVTYKYKANQMRHLNNSSNNMISHHTMAYDTVMKLFIVWTHLK